MTGGAALGSIITEFGLPFNRIPGMIRISNRFLLDTIEVPVIMFFKVRTLINFPANHIQEMKKETT
jgi:hypothetical protein